MCQRGSCARSTTKPAIKTVQNASFFWMKMNTNFCGVRPYPAPLLCSPGSRLLNIWGRGGGSETWPQHSCDVTQTLRVEIVSNARSGKIRDRIGKQKGMTGMCAQVSINPFHTHTRLVLCHKANLRFSTASGCERR